MVVAGRADVDITPKVSQEIAKYYVADYYAFEGVSHVGALLGKRWQEIAAAVKSWIETT